MYILIFIASLLLTFLVSFSASGYFSFFIFSFKFVFSGVLFFFFTLFVLKLASKRNKSIPLSILLISIPPVLILGIHVFDFQRTLISFPSNLVFILGISFGLLFHQIQSKIKKLTLSTIYLIAIFIMGLVYYPKWLHYLSFGNFSGNITKEYKMIEFTGINEKQEKVDNSILNGKVVVFDFWDTACGYCKAEFPEFKKLSKKHSSNDTLFIAYNYPLERDDLDRALNFFDVDNTEISLIIPNDRNLFDTLGINGTPTYVVVNSLSEIEYYGNIKNLEKFLISD
ncbi:TlpA family protein disulfide reductase [Brumimicrobium mesophilum]|uniref:TlpA family protein disulfide reductase n=1 Tax=Brumimicrobium mesophilum TaxID=392717 RepID=UPI000D141C71|nr:TlpA disulfide reductase family protein [Brumimicrobium mesophilum]